MRRLTSFSCVEGNYIKMKQAVGYFHRHEGRIQGETTSLLCLTLIKSSTLVPVKVWVCLQIIASTLNLLVSFKGLDTVGGGFCYL